MNTRSPVVRSAVVLAFVIVGLSLFDRFLANIEIKEVQRESHQAFAAGSHLLESGKPREAVEYLRTAHVLSRQNPDYSLQLGRALLIAGKAEEAQPLIDEALQREPNDGWANLVAARLMEARRMRPEARAFYHRAIYGNWMAGSASKVAARMELIELLIREGNRKEALPEAISLAEEDNKDPGVRKRTAHYFRIADAPGRAAVVYRDLIARNREDVDAYRGLGEAELDQGDYRSARTAFVKAFSLSHNSAALLPRLSLVNTLAALDPTPRQLTSREKYRRSLRLLSLVRDDIANHPSAGFEETLKDVDKALSKKDPLHVTNELAEDVLSLAEKVWRQELERFGQDSPDDHELLRIMMKKLAA